jgi:hypothetical protein
MNLPGKNLDRRLYLVSAALQLLATLWLFDPKAC